MLPNTNDAEGDRAMWFTRCDLNPCPKSIAELSLSNRSPAVYSLWARKHEFIYIAALFGGSA